MEIIYRSDHLIHHLSTIQTAMMGQFFSMMGIHSPLTTPVELYLFVWTMSMALCVMTGGTLWMPQLCVLSWDSLPMVASIKSNLAR